MYGIPSRSFGFIVLAATLSTFCNLHSNRRVNLITRHNLVA